MNQPISPFHSGEIEAQSRAGRAERAAETGRFIRDFMPRQHRDFFASLPFLVVAGVDSGGLPWVSILEGRDSVVGAHDPHSLTLAGHLAADDPLLSGFMPGASLGVLGIDPATRRRNRVNGRLRQDGNALVLDVRQSFGNCAQHIRPRHWHRVAKFAEPARTARVSDRPSDAQKQWIRSADTFFIGSGQSSGREEGSDGHDASHRGGEPGFVHIDAEGRLCIPDYAGNDFFNTIGNLLRDPRVGLLFVDFDSGGLLQLTGRAEIIWNGRQSHDPNARRMIIVTIDRVVERPAALALRWRMPGADGMKLRVLDRVQESREVTSFHLAPVAAGPLADFRPGQHLPIALEIPGHPGPLRRSYSLSGPAQGKHYRISVKHKGRGMVSGYLHDHLQPGDVITASNPSGDFLMPDGDTPLVLVSAGVGVTPVLAMLHAHVAGADMRPLWFVHGTQNRGTHAFREEIADLIARAPHAQKCTHYSRPDPEDRRLAHHDREGRVTARDLVALGAGASAHYMICGPVRFTADLIAGLTRLGVPAGQIHHESFGPAG
ncbi:pyridoxamine 5'-phosphate oxidase family protein [Paracoccus seriniphilus]|uniref:FAD-binding FR-type domain-containing protein n=1 Tax=Paracoccus seriniphilus TaxID=184748 RepID=A0A239PU73_9RHOB|nr:pyridoxamine 5'-phosphate oxidase family protein [Paracoccus seriniphilus]WCR15369.1 pyridoxamine 5'-phosphate oxidase family protein [Paracoccus seriniphilus]SNT73849.1 hypothetical protein SAMN05444959_10629 [Paracoccus seriniphilus]